MMRIKILVTICVSVLALIVFETLFNGIFLSVGSSHTANPGVLKYFLPSIIAAMIVAVPMALNYRPDSFKMCVVTAAIWLVIDLYLLPGNTIASDISLETVLYLTVAYGPKLAALIIFLSAGYFADKILVNR